jgi:hypothetical protein
MDRQTGRPSPATQTGDLKRLPLVLLEITFKTAQNQLLPKLRRIKEQKTSAQRTEGLSLSGPLSHTFIGTEVNK